MQVRILKVENNTLVDAEIKEKFKLRLPTVTDGWRFNFNKHAKKKGACVYIVIAEETPSIIEGCMVYNFDQMQGIYLAYFEIAPHNKGEKRKYELVAECLIAYAGKLSYELVEGYSRGWLTFDVLEENKDDEIKLISMYNKKYGALQIQGTTIMCILPANTENIIEKYLKI